MEVSIITAGLTITTTRSKWEVGLAQTSCFLTESTVFTPPWWPFLKNTNSHFCCVTFPPTTELLAFYLQFVMLKPCILSHVSTGCARFLCACWSLVDSMESQSSGHLLFLLLTWSSTTLFRCNRLTWLFCRSELKVSSHPLYWTQLETLHHDYSTQSDWLCDINQFCRFQSCVRVCVLTEH